jgi:hypothetical protein
VVCHVEREAYAAAVLASRMADGSPSDPNKALTGEATAPRRRIFGQPPPRRAIIRQGLGDFWVPGGGV